VFAESKSVLDKLKPFKDLFKRIVNRNELKKCDSVMFFDYPADRKTYDYILEKTNPSALHFMNYDYKEFDDAEFFKTVIGMLKYAHKNNDGKIELIRCASFLGKSYEVLDLLFSILQEADIIKIKEKTSDYYMIEMMPEYDISKVLHNKNYPHLIGLIEECSEFQKNLLEEELSLI
ncbi:hypothetical protein II906_00685, partial [bacterium]|nr:hypothetical protein [bacterium]